MEAERQTDRQTQRDRQAETEILDRNRDIGADR